MEQKRFAWIQPNSRTSSTLTHLPVRLPLNAASLGNSSSGSFMPSKRALPGLGESTRNSPDFLREGILATYSPTDATPHQFKRNLSDQEWLAFGDAPKKRSHHPSGGRLFSRSQGSSVWCELHISHTRHQTRRASSSLRLESVSHKPRTRRLLSG